MAARHSSQHLIPLFPFLAVLMCALGALILMLVVITSRMRNQARAEAIELRDTIIAESASATRLRPGMHSHRRWQPTTIPPDPVLHPGSAPRPPVPPPATESLREQWQGTIANLEATLAAEQAAFQSRRTSTEAEEATLQALEAQLADQQLKVNGLTRQRTAAQLKRDRDAARRTELERDISERQSEIEQLRVQQTAAASRYSILPYDGQTGTVRRPIYIECTETGLRFASEDITLTPEQLDGFPALRNPLIAGADALFDYWSLRALKDPAAAEGGRPYVLLIVRPRGTVGYYVARRMLDTLDQQFGYELVPDDLEIAWPKTEPGAIAACRAAIDAALQDRGRYVAGGGNAPPGSLEPLSVTDGSGAFALDEVEQLKGGERMVYFGGREVNRASGGRGSSPSPFGHGGDGAGSSPGGVPGGPSPTAYPPVDGGNRGRLAQSGSAPTIGTGSPGGFPVAAGTAVAGNAANSFTEQAAAQPRGAGQQLPGMGQPSGRGDNGAGSLRGGVPGGPSPTAFPQPDGGKPGRLAQSGSAPTVGAGSPGGIPAAGTAVAGNAANSFTEQAAAQSRGAGQQLPGSGQPSGRGGGGSAAQGDAGVTVRGSGPGAGLDQGGRAGHADGGDTSPRPLPSLDDIDPLAMPQARAAIQNPGAVLRDPGSQIGMERKVYIRVEAQRVVIEAETPIVITPGMSREELQSRLAETLRSHFQGWGRPPRSFYWLPQIKYSVLPGGHQHAQRLVDFTKEWELPSQVDYALE